MSASPCLRSALIVQHVVSQVTGIYLPWNKSALLQDRHTPNPLPALAWYGIAQDVLHDLSQSTCRRLAVDSSQIASTIIQHLSHVSATNGRILTIIDHDYPAALREIVDPPLLLTVLGNVDLLDRPAVSIIGSRQASRLALDIAEDVGLFLAENGYLVVSGGAIGCDIAAHFGALHTKKPVVPTANIFAHGLKRFLPQQNQEIFRRLRERGSLFVSERLWDTGCFPYDFPTRNRLISGLSHQLIIIQCTPRSGTLVTANLALDQGRDVIVFDPRSDDIRFQGNSLLLQDGALGFTNLSELAAHLENAGAPIIF